MSYKSSESIGLLTQNGNNCDYPSLDPDFPVNEELFSGHQSPPYWISGSGFRSTDQFDGEPIGENLEGEQQTYHSSFGYLLNELDSTSYRDICRDLSFHFHDTYGNGDDCRMENTEDIRHDEDQFEDYPGSINLDYESAWECLKSWFGHEDEHGYDWSKQELKPTYDCKSDDMTLFDSILGYWPCYEGKCGHQ